MSTVNPEELMYNILVLKEAIDRVTSKLDGIEGIETGVFSELSLPMPRFSPAELGFLRMVSWLYVLYNESGKINVDFLSERFSAYELDPDGELSAHRRTVQQLRTFLQHNLDPGEPHNRRIQEACEDWFRCHCGTPHPGTEEQWRSCLVVLLGEALSFFEALQKCIRCIEQDESHEQIAQSWDFRRKRYHPPHQFDRLISIVSADMGRESLDVVRLRKRFYDKWAKELQSLQGNYEFEVEARKLIEHALLHETTGVLPITGYDIMEKFGISPGPQVGQILRQARSLYNVNPCSRDDLLEQLRQEINTDDNGPIAQLLSPCTARTS
jgi:hypothetical protein